MAVVAEREFALALEKVPPSEEAHLAMLEVAAGHGKMQDLKGLYYAHEEDWPFVKGMMAKMAIIEQAQAIAHEAPPGVRQAGNIVQFGGFLFGVKDVLMWGSKKFLGHHGPLVVALVLMAIMIYLIRDFAQAMYLLIRFY
jgi:hypothetical protein